jgi:ribonuclease G
MTRLGLLEMTRKKVRESLLNQMTRVCPACEGRGHILSEEVIARRLRQRIVDRLRESGADAILAEAHPQIAAHLIGPGGANLKELERETHRSVFVRGAVDCALEELKVRKVGSRAAVEAMALPVQEGMRLDLIVEERHQTNTKDGISRVAGYVIDIEGAGHRVGDRVSIEIQRTFRTFATAKIVAAVHESGEPASIQDSATHVV